MAIHATLTARDFFLAYIYPSGPFTCSFSKPLPIFPVLVVANTWFLCRIKYVRIKYVNLPEAGSRVECPRNINKLKKKKRKA